jgi:hypothetical protein
MTKAETIPVQIPKDMLKSAEEIGLSKEKLSETMKRFAILEIVSNLSKLNKEEAERISNEMKAKVWKKTKEKLKI